MDGTIPTPPASSTVTSSSEASLQVSPYQLLEINLISAQDLSRIAKSMKTYAVAWLNPNRKLTTHVDSQGNVNPTWNEKLLFKIDEKFLSSDKSSLNIEIYTLSWFRDILIGTVNVLIYDLIPPSTRNDATKRFVKLQVRRPSGTPQGILNMGFSIGKATAQNISLYSELSADNKLEKECIDDLEGNEERKLHTHEKINLWRSHSANELADEDFIFDDGSGCNGSVVNGSMVNGSMVNGSELCSDVGPSASVVAAELAQKSQPVVTQRPLTPPTLPPRAALRAAEAEDVGSSILEEITLEEAMANGWMTDYPANGRQNGQLVRRNPRRHSDGGGLFSCFGNAYGIQIHIVCGNNNKNKNANNNGNKGRVRKS